MRYASLQMLLRLFAVLCCALGLALPYATAPAQSLQRQNFTTDDGLPQNSVHAVLQTRDGFLWAATEGGVVRFDGVAFERFGTENERAFPSNDACCLAQTADGMLWIGTSDGLVRWSGTRFDRVNTGPVLQLVAEPAGGLLVLTAHGLQRVSGLQANDIPLPGGREATAIGRARDGSPLVAAGTSLLRAQAGTFRIAGQLSIAPLDLFEDDAGCLWLRSTAEVQATCGAAQHRWRTGTDLPGTRLLSLLAAGTDVFAATNRGVYRIRADASSPVALPELAGTAVLSATADREGDLWFGTDTAGLATLRPQAIQTVPALATDAITSIVQTRDGVLWAGTRDSGLRRATGPAATVSAPLQQGLILSLSPGTAGDLWVGTPDGLYHSQQNRLSHLTSADGLPDDFIRSLLADGPDAVWIGTRHGAAHLRAGSVDRLLTTAEGLPSDVVGTTLRTRDGTLWFGTLHGLARLQGGRAEPVALAGGDPADSITALAEAPEGTLLVGTHSGMLAFSHAGPFTAVRVSGIQGEIDALLPDAAGNLWVRSPAGVQRLALADLLRCRPAQPCTPAVRTYGTADGMPSVDSSSDGHPSAWRTADGVLWFATRRGVARIDAAHLPIDRVPPHVVFERIQIDDLTFTPAASIRLGPGHRRFVFDYAALSLRAPLQVTYRFRLEGFDRDWIDAGTRRSAEYTNLPPGTYRLLVEARNADGTPSTTPAELQFHIAAPIYRRWWFYALLLLAAAAVVYAMYRLRLRRVQQQFTAVLNERNRIAREIHDTLAQDFVAVSLQLEVTAQLLKVQATAAAQEQIDATRLLVRDGIRDARESIWALRAGQSAADLPARLRALVDTAPATPAQSLTVTGSYRALASSFEKETLRIAKEAIGNAVRHAGAAHIELTLLYSEDAVILTVRDDGAGFDVDAGAARAGHYGLRGMRERAAAMGATLGIVSAPGQGTTVTLRLES